MNEDSEDTLLRSSSLIAGTTKKMALTYVGSAMCAAAVVIIDSLVAGVSIGEKALAAIAAAGPLLSVGQILHCMLGFGIDKLMVQAIGKGKRGEANRIFGAILIAVIVVYLLVFMLLIVLERPLLESILDDPTLSGMVIDYTVPLFATEAIFEAFLCIERAFRIDGRARLFSLRSIVTNIANIAFDLLLVSALGLGVSGLAWSSVLSTAIGYTITLSHFFSKKRTVSPDFSVVRDRKEFLTYVTWDVRLGSSATLDEVMSSVALTLQTTTVGTIGGAGGLAIWAVYKSVRGVILSASNGVAASVSVHAGLLFGQGDYDGVRYSVKEGALLAQAISAGAIVLTLLLAGGIVDVYHIAPELHEVGATCLRIGCVAFPPLAFLTVFTAYLPAVDKIRMTNRLVMVQHGLTMVPAVFGYTLGLSAFFSSYVGALWFTLVLVAYLLMRNRYWFVPASNPEMIAGYSIRLRPDQISALCVDVEKELADSRYSKRMCSWVALLVEEGVNYIAQHNTGAEISADVEVKRAEGGLLSTIIDNGSPYNPITKQSDSAWEELEWREPGVLETVVIRGLATDIRYDRVLDLNHLSLFTAFPDEDRP